MLRSPLRAALLVALPVALSGALLGAACGGGGDGAPDASPVDADVAPAFRNPVDLPDDQLALRALQVLGADVEGASSTGCTPCHSMTENRLREWADFTNDALGDCLTDLAVSSEASARQMLECVQQRGGTKTGKYVTYALGFWSAGAERDWWSYAFRKAYPEDGATRWGEFVDNVRMPPGGLPLLTDDDYDVVAEWFVRGVPLLDELLDEEPQPGECDALVTPAVGDHVAAQATSGWRAINADAGMLMFGCGGATDPRDCLTGEPDATTTEAGAGWAVAGQGVLRLLHTTGFASAYWSRGSADGRFVGSGAHNSGGDNLPFGRDAAIVDLMGDDRTIPVDAAYDPGFFPDNRGFMLQGGPRNTCAMSVLTANPTEILMTEPGCAAIGEVGLYQHVGAAPGGDDYFAIDGPFVSDDGGHFVTSGNPRADFGADAVAGLIPMVYDGSTFDAVDAIAIPTPYEGDPVLSPSARLLITRVTGPQSVQNGYILRRVDATPSGGSFDVATPTIARYCLEGGKPAFSYDERWMVIHHYVEDTDADAQALGFVNAQDAGFAPYVELGASNIYLVELTTGQATRITNMAPGQYALYPYFRSDGWIYFQVRVLDQRAEYVVASDAALVAEEN